MNDVMRPTRDVVVIGASAGGVTALPRVLAQLPADLPAALGIVQHLSAMSTMHMVTILQRGSKLPVSWAEHEDAFEPGRVLVAPPGVHMMIADGHVVLVGGPRENRARPAINRLFRSAARSYGGRVIGVLLTGLLDDGVSGLAAIRASGGVTLVQDPSDAEYESMPRAAVVAGAATQVLPLDAIGQRIALLVREPAAARRVPDEVRNGAAMDAASSLRPEAFDPYEQTPLTCPECGGPLWEVGEGALRSYRCFLGHAETPLSLLAGNDREVERALWAAVRALQDRALTLEKLAGDAVRMGTRRSAAHYSRSAEEARTQAEHARQFLVDLQRRMESPPTVEQD